MLQFRAKSWAFSLVYSASLQFLFVKQALNLIAKQLVIDIMFLLLLSSGYSLLGRSVLQHAELSFLSQQPAQHLLGL